VAYTGNKAKIPLGEFGLLTDVAPDKVPPNALIKANNVCFFNGAVEKAPGTIKWNDTALSAGIIALYQWRPTLEKERMIAVTSAGDIFRGQDRQFGSAINSTIASSLTPNCLFAEGGAETAGRDKKLFLFTGGTTNPYVLSGDGTAFSTLSASNTDWTSPTTFPKFGLVHRNRLWAFAGQISYASDSGNHENFQTANLTEPVYPGEGGELRGAAVFKGRLFAFKDGGFTYLLNDQDNSESNWYWQKISNNFDLAAPNAVTEVLDDMIAGNTSGTITSYAASDKLGSVEAADIIQEMQFESFLRGNTSKVGVPFQHVLYYAEKKILFATYRSAYYTYNDMLIMIDFGRNDRLRPAFWVKGSPQCLSFYQDVNQIKRPMYGDKDGYIHMMDQQDRLEGSTAYTGEFQTPHLDFSHLDPALSSAEKHFDFLAVHYMPESTGALSCDYFIDGRFVETVTFSMIQYRRPELGVLTLGTDRLAQPNEETAIVRLAGTGRTFSARFYNAGSNQSFRIPAITIYFRGGGDKAQQV
jgi:hypothetical protein